MPSTLPKGHLSCLSSAFRYTPAVRTNIAETFARIKQELQEREADAPASQEAPVIVRVGRPVSRETIERAIRLLHAGGLRPAPRLVHSSDL
ncbi:MAG TPA: hypothetical protein VLD36_14930 [Burkholderiales bacterium]|jgi:hypothetical protein|nr:hypothetical protein [Burkholderiales bacterium]